MPKPPVYKGLRFKVERRRSTDSDRGYWEVVDTLTKTWCAAFSTRGPARSYAQHANLNEPQAVVGP